MASLYAANYTKAFRNVPSEKLDVTQVGGRVRVLWDQISLTAILSASDKIYVGKLPKGAKVIQAYISAPDLGTTGTLDLGYEYNLPADSALTDDPNAFIDAMDVNAAALTFSMTDEANIVGLGYEMESEADIVVTASAATTATSGVIKVCVLWTLD